MPYTHQPEPLDTIAIEMECRARFQREQFEQAKIEARLAQARAMLDVQIQLAVAHLTAPWQALADYLRAQR
jgi:hypothetical protein